MEAASLLPMAGDQLRPRWPGRLLAILALCAVPVLVAAWGGSSDAAERRLFGDAGGSADAAAVWGKIDCASSGRHRQILVGGDPRPDPGEGALGTTAFRRLTVFDGDNVYGERCELGLNDWREGPTAVYREGQRRVTTVTLRLPDSFPLRARRWQTVVQMKQAQPSAGGGGSPMIQLLAFNGRWHLSVATNRNVRTWTRWHGYARHNRWVRFRFDVRYSRHHKRGVVRLRADLNADGDFRDRKERAGPFHGTTLKREPGGGGDDGVSRGSSIPSHLRVGIYHDDPIKCPDGCSIDVDSVHVSPG